MICFVWVLVVVILCSVVVVRFVFLSSVLIEFCEMCWLKMVGLIGWLRLRFLRLVFRLLDCFVSIVCRVVLLGWCDVFIV